MKTKLILLALILLLNAALVFSQTTYEATIEQTKDGNNLNVDIFIRTISGTSASLGFTTLCFDFNSAALAYVGKDVPSDGRWDDGNAPNDYFDLNASSVGPRASLDVTPTYNVGATGLDIPTTVTRVGRLVFTIINNNQNSNLAWNTTFTGFRDWAFNDFTQFVTLTNPPTHSLGGPEIDVQRPAATSIADDGTDNVGNQAIGPVNLTYTIDNTAGTTQLNVTAVTAANLVNCSGFSVNNTLPLNIPAAATAVLQVSFNVDAAGAFSFDMDIENNDVDENPYDIAVSGIGGSPTSIELSSFTAEVGQDGILTNWSTETEPNNAGFNIYRSTEENVNKRVLVRDGDRNSYYKRCEERDIAAMVRLIHSTWDQDGMLSGAEICVLLNRSLTTIQRYIKKYEAEHPDEALPLKGYILDQGSRPTHKGIILTLYEQGIDPTEITKRTNHDLESVDRYIKTYNRVKELYRKGFSREEIKKVAGSYLTTIDQYLRIALHFYPDIKEKWQDTTKK
ncbi:DUF1670 domain-containing protein [candidate division KSB1 bacterium]|nr:DUF1670 domain-containing protein [candidate division KSB1 bacterium]